MAPAAVVDSTRSSRSNADRAFDDVHCRLGRLARVDVDDIAPTRRPPPVTAPHLASTRASVVSPCVRRRHASSARFDSTTLDHRPSSYPTNTCSERTNAAHAATPARIVRVESEPAGRRHLVASARLDAAIVPLESIANASKCRRRSRRDDPLTSVRIARPVSPRRRRLSRPDVAFAPAATSAAITRVPPRAASTRSRRRRRHRARRCRASRSRPRWERARARAISRRVRVSRVMTTPSASPVSSARRLRVREGRTGQAGDWAPARARE